MSHSISTKPTSGDVWNSYVIRMDLIKYFYIQKVSNFNDFQKLCSEATTSDNAIKKTRFNVGDIVAARDEYGIWHRARIEDKHKSGLIVCFIDLRTSGIFTTDFKNLPTQFVTKKSIYHRCALKGLPIEDEIKLLNNDFFYIINTFVTSNEMTVTFLNETDPYLIKLSYNGTDILSIISRLIWGGIVPSLIDDPIDIAKFDMLNKLASCDKTIAICVDPVISVNNFYIEIKSSHIVGKKIRTIIDSKKNWTSILHPEEGKIVIAKNPQDNILYRARVVLNYEDSRMCKCFLFDCGTFVDCSEFFEPSGYLLKAPPVKIHCSLKVGKKIQHDLLESITLSFIDELKINSDNSIIVDMIEIGSPCMIDLKIENIRLSKLIIPRKVKIIHIDDINSFQARLLSKSTNKLHNVLSNVKNFHTVSDPEILKLYVAKINENEYKRVKYFGTYDLSHEVLIVDDNCVRTFVPEVFKIPKSIKNIKTLDVYGSLGLNARDYSTKKFIDICNDGKTEFLMIVAKSDFINGHTVKLYLNSKDVATMICN